MTFETKLRKFLDKYHKGYYIEKYIINDGEKHPVAVICLGGGYHWICSFSEGMPYAKKLNRMGYKKYGLPKPAAIILSYPVITMYEKAHKGSRRYLLGDNPSLQMLEQASVEKQITADYPPTFVWHGLADKDVNPDNSKLLTEKFIEKGVKYRCVTYDGVDHGVGIGEGLPCDGWFEKAVCFWENCFS